MESRMEEQGLTEVIAEQEVEFLRIDGTASAVRAKLGRPKRETGTPERNWTCPYQITGVGNERVKATVGLDGIHALSLALHMFPIELVGLVEKERGSLRYLGQQPVFFGGLCQTLLRNT